MESFAFYDYLERQEKWDRRYLELAKEVSTWSKDPSTQVGAVLVSPSGKEFVGFNGFPRGIADTEARWHNRDLKYKFVVHAEINAILKAGEAARGGTLYVYPAFSLPPICHDCAKCAIQAGVAGIVGYLPDPQDPRVVRWKDSIAVSAEMWDEAGCFIRAYEEAEHG